jgi:hypothetical protein
MKRGLKTVGVVLACLVLTLVTLRIVGLNPRDRFPGLWMTGELVTTPVTDWTFAEKEEGLIGIQTREWFLPILPHSINTGWYVHRGHLCIGSAYTAGQDFPNGRHWNRNVMNDPHVRLKLGGKLYDVKLVYVSDPAERDKIHIERKNMNRFSNPGMNSHVFCAMPSD